jgi:hypothetical protein
MKFLMALDYLLIVVMGTDPHPYEVGTFFDG